MRLAPVKAADRSLHRFGDGAILRGIIGNDASHHVADHNIKTAISLLANPTMFDLPARLVDNVDDRSIVLPARQTCNVAAHSQHAANCEAWQIRPADEVWNDRDTPRMHVDQFGTAHTGDNPAG